MLDRLRRLWRDKTGVAAIEFALMAPLLMALFIGCVEVTFKLWSTQKAEKLAVTLADVVAQSQEVKAADLSALLTAIEKIMDPFPFAESDGVVYITSVYLPQPEEGEALGDPIVNWQYKKGALSKASKIGTEGSDAVLPPDFDLNERDNVIVAEVFYKYKPMAPGLMFEEGVVYRRAFFKPRLGALTDKPS